jgi:putative DNA primase/helicase
MMTLAHVLARLERVRPCAGGFVALCPGHVDRNASLSIRERENGRLLFRCFAGCSYEAIRDALGGRPSKTLGLGLPTTPHVPLDDKKRTELALRVWRESKPAAGLTLVERYLRGRGIAIPVPPTIRFHPNLRHPSGVYAPAMVAAVEHVRSGNTVIAIHRTWLRDDGNGKAALDPQKAALGPIAGGAVRLTPTGETLALAEGIETALSVLQATAVPIWATLGTANLSRVELPDCVREVLIAADSGEPGERAAHEAAAWFMREGRRVRIARPRGRKDFNEMRL